jgi:TolB-like protein/Tfp pilus assembly protein PilF
MGFVAELKRRNVVRMAGLYLVGAWLVVQVAGTLLPMFGAPVWMPRAVVILVAVGFLPMLVFSWVYELTPEGLKRESDIDRNASPTPGAGQRIEHALVVLLALGIGYFAFDKFVLAQRREAAQAAATAASVAQARKEAGVEALVGSNPDKSIAVLPFVNMSADQEQEFFADGVAEELLNQLAKVHGLRVIARTSSFSFKGKNADVATIAGALHVAHLLEGSVRRSGNRLRISAKLVRAADGSELWSETYDRQMEDIFAMQDEIAGAVVGELKLKLLGSAAGAKTADPEAYALVLQARQSRQLRTPEALARTASLLEEAVQRDPGLGEAWAELAVVHLSQANAGILSNAEGYGRARDAANKALSLDPALALAHVQLATVARANLDLATIAKHLSAAAEIAPEDISLLRETSRVAGSLGRFDDSLGYAEAVVARDPKNPRSYGNLGNAYLEQGRWAEGVRAYQQAIRMSPGYFTAYDALCDGFIGLGKLQEALDAANQEPDSPWRYIALTKAYHALGRKADSDAALAELIRRYPVDAPYNIGYLYAVRGEPDLAFQWLEKAATARDPGLIEAASSSYLDNLHKDPRWLPFLQRLGLAPEQLAAIKLNVPIPQPG